MKKVLLLTAAIVVLASCSQNESELLKNPANEIRFSNLNDRVTRAANDAGDDYQVYAKSGVSGETTWFIDDVIDGGTNLAVGGPYYWPASASVNFFAYAPATSGTVTATYGTPAVSITYNVLSTADEDFTVATPMTGLTKASGSPAGTVEFQFEHMLTMITIDAELASPDLDAYTLDLTSATAEIIVASNQGTLDATASSPAFTAGGSSATYTGAITKNYMIMPQTSTGTTIQLKGVSIKRNGADVFTGDLLVYPIVSGDIPTNAFVKGTHYTLTFTITDVSSDDNGDPIFGPEIKFTATTSTWIPSGISLIQP